MTLTVNRYPDADQRAAELLALEKAVQRELRRVFLRAIVLCFLWLFVGLALIGWSVHTTSFENGIIAFWGGLFVANLGIVITLLVTYHRAMEEGWL
jgi:fatty acid desaturase